MQIAVMKEDESRRGTLVMLIPIVIDAIFRKCITDNANAN